MDHVKVRHLISNLRRHYNIRGEEILTCYDTAIAALRPYHGIPYATVSISPKRWTDLHKRTGDAYVTKHPGSNVECLLLFGSLYVRREARVDDSRVMWCPNTGCYTVGWIHLKESMESIVAGNSTKKQIKHASNVLSTLATVIKGE